MKQLKSLAVFHDCLNATSIDQIIIKRLMGMSNYKTALDYFLENEVTEELV